MIKKIFNRLLKNVFFWVFVALLALVLFVFLFEHYESMGTNKYYNLF